MKETFNFLLDNFFEIFPYAVVLSFLLTVSSLVIYFAYFKNNKSSKNECFKRSLSLSRKDLDLLCRCISDSMHYDKSDYNEKYDVLFKIKCLIYDSEGGVDNE